MPSPAFVLVRPQLGMNIGMAARAMANFALQELRLVQPRDGWPNPEAGPPAAGADEVLARAICHESVADALADCQLTFATTARPRDMEKPVLTPRQAAERMREGERAGLKSGVLFGPERSGLTAADLAAVQTIVTCPVDPRFASLNLAQAVLLTASEWFQGKAAGQGRERQPPAAHGEVASLIRHVEDELQAAGYFHVAERTPATRRSIAQLFSRPQFTSAEVRMLHGIVRTLAEGPKRRRPG